jgi:hypothetical protein
MLRGHERLASLILGLSLLLPLATIGCAHHYYTAYDPYHNDSHRWDAQEDAYYHQWVIENHMDANRDYRHLSKDDQKRYWDWRHSHDKDHDHDHDHDNH